MIMSIASSLETLPRLMQALEMLIKAAPVALLALPLFTSCASTSAPDALSGLAAETGHELYRVRGWPVLMDSELVSEDPD
jgi:hypothetical protein